MAERRVKYILEVDYEGESVTVKAADDLREVDNAARQADDGLKQAGDGFSKLQANVVTAQAALGVAEQAFQTVQAAAQFAYETLSEGAGLADARGDFEDLATSIGTTAEAMTGELRSATGGLMTDAELIGQASEMMALNLGLTGDEIVKLSGVAAELDWDMSKLTDTLNTGSTRGLKEMGLSIAEVNARAGELEEQGLATDKAFTWAIIEAAEAKIDRVGKKSEEAAGQIQQLEVIAANVQDEFARGAAEGFADALGMIADSAPAAGAALDDAARGVSYYGTQLLALASINLFGGTLDFAVDKGQQMQAEAAAVEETVRSYQWLINQYDAYHEAWERNIDINATFTDAELAEMAAAEGAAEAHEWNARAAAWMADEQERAAVADYARKQSLGEAALSAEDFAARQGAATDAAQRWAEVTAELTATGGDYFTQFSQGGPDVWNYAEALYATADAAGAGIGPLAEMAVNMGLISQEQADAATVVAQQQTIMDSLAGAAAAGKIAWEDYGTAVQQALDILENGMPEAPEPVRVPVELEWDQTYGGDPIVPDMEVIQVPIGANNAEVLAAVEEAKGIVDGFANPAEVYEAVMNMDIADVEADIQTATGLVNTFVNPAEIYEAIMHMDIAEVVTKSAEATTLINSLPDQKTVTINVQAIGMGILDELRAAGVIP